ncbi:MAG TPA: translation initiation factor IF-2 N-terminal domain-containing protein, partial [Solirubrobacteraceae bacterium]|nr:translation initiation factor IF-2 N-terminal domain-containing protein [Solirubrobacteraceae bacterium]
MAKIRVHELAKEREMSPRDMLAKLQAAGLPVKAVASAVDKQMAEDALAGKKVTPKTNGAGNAPQARSQRVGGTSDSPRPLGTGDGPRPVRQTRQAQE